MGIKILLIYLLIENILTFAIYGIDKWKAVHDKWRIKEATLLILAFLGGGMGALLGMQVFHHKTQKWYFRFTVPVMLILQVGLMGYFLFTM